MTVKMVGLSEYVKEKLEEIKKRDKHTSLDSVIRYLLVKSGEVTLESVFYLGNYPLFKEGDHIRIGDKYYKIVEVERK